MNARPFLAVMAALAVVALLSFGLLKESGSALAAGDEAPEITLERLDGSGIASLSEYEGKWVLVNFWASWCPPCATESPAIEDFARANATDLVVVGINSQDLSDDATAFVDEFDLSWEMLRDGGGEYMDDYGVVGLPETFLVDPGGRVALLQRGPIDADFLEAEVAPLIGGTAS